MDYLTGFVGYRSKPTNRSAIYRCAKLVTWMILLIGVPVAAGGLPPFQTLVFTKEPKNEIVLEGSSTMLSCSALYNNSPPSVYSWERNGELLSVWSDHGVNTRIMFRNGSLYFSEVRSTGPSLSLGNYRCIAEVSDGAKAYRIATPSARLQVAVLNNFIISPTSLSLRVGDTAMFRCLVDSAPPATYQWSKDGFRLHPSARVLLHDQGNVLEVLSVGQEDAGRYTCTALAMSGSRISNPATLSLENSNTASSQPSAPGFVMKPVDTSAVEGTTAFLYCCVNGSLADGERPTVTWLRRGSTIDTGEGSRNAIIGNGTLRIVNVTRGDQGVYTCRGENSEDVSDTEATLTILVPPYFEKRPSNVYGRVNEDIEFQCDIRGMPEPRVYWLKDSDLVRTNAFFRMTGRNLRIMGLMKSDSGFFQCVGENEVGEVYSTAQLIVLDEDAEVSPSTGFTGDVSDGTSTTAQTILSNALPPAPSELRAALISQTSVTLTWRTNSTEQNPIVVYMVTTTPISDTSRVRAVNTTSTDCTIQGLLPGTTYVFQVTSFNRNGRSLQHTELRVLTTQEAAVPGVVSNMRAWPESHQAIRVLWDAPQDTNGNVTEYRVYYYSSDQSLEQFTTSVTLNAILLELHPYTEYHIRIVAYNRNGPGSPTEERVVRTLSSKPSAAPEDVSLEVTGTASIAVRWAPPTMERVNGQLTGFKIRYKAKLSFGRWSAHVTDADARTYEITGLDSGTVYSVRVAAININGSGELSPVVDATTLIEELDESRPPGQPRNIQTRALPRSMVVSWVPPEGAVLVRGYRLGYGSITPDEVWITSIHPSTRIYTLENLQPQSNYVVQIIAFNHAGDGPSGFQQDFTREDISSESDSALIPPMEVRATVISSTSVVVTWYDNTLGQNQKVTDDRYYTVKCNALSGSAHRKTKYVNSTDLIVRVNDLRPNTKYEFSVMTSKGNRHSTYSMTARNTTLEAAPDSPPLDLTVSLIEGRPFYLLVSWQPPTKPNGNIISYSIYSNTNSQDPLDRWIVDGVLGSVMNYDFGPVTPETVYYFCIAAHNNRGMSPLSKIVVVKTPNSDGVGGIGGVLDEKRQDVGWYTPNSALFERPAGEGDTYLDTTPATLLSSSTLWIAIACVCGVTVVAVPALVAVLCRRRVLKQRKQANSSKAAEPGAKGGAKPQPPDLWIDHEQMELRGGDRRDAVMEPDEMSSMMDMDRSVSMTGDMYTDDLRYSTLGRIRPVVIAQQAHREAMPRAAVPPMAVDSGRPLYPRTQFAGPAQYSSTPRVHVGDTSIPGSVKPQPTSPFRSQLAQAPESNPSSSLKLLSRNPYSHGASSSRDDLKHNVMTQSTEQLSAEMAHLDCIMQDLNAIKNDFDY